MQKTKDELLAIEAKSHSGYNRNIFSLTPYVDNKSLMMGFKKNIYQMTPKLKASTLPLTQLIVKQTYVPGRADLNKATD